MAKEILGSFYEGGVKDPSRRRFLRKVGVAIVGGSVAMFTGTLVGLGKIVDDIERDAEKQALLSRSPANKQDLQEANSHVRDVANNKVPIDASKLGESYQVIRQQDAFDETKRDILDRKLWTEIDMIRTFGPLTTLPIGGAGLGLYIDNREPKLREISPAEKEPQTT